MKATLKLLRVHQWIKNFFIWFPAFFGGVITTGAIWPDLLGGFIAFSFVASAVYIFNDWRDLEKDKLHPEKKHRPLANGDVSIGKATWLFAIFLLMGLGIGFLLDVKLLYILLAYLLMNLMYSLYLKRFALVDITIVAFGFLLRAWAGGILADVLLSKWLVLITFLAALMLAISKRRHDLGLIREHGEMRASLKGYTAAYIDAAMVFMASVTTVCYILYSVSEEVIARIGSDYLYLTDIFVVLGILRYLQLSIVFDKTSSPTMVLLKDSFILVIVILWLISFFIILYLT